MSEKLKQFASYTVGDEDYQNFSLSTVISREGGAEDPLDNLKRNPVDSGVPFKAIQELPSLDDPDKLVEVSQDPMIQTYAYGGNVRACMFDIVTRKGEAMSYKSTVSLLAMPQNARSHCSVLARDITVLDKLGGYALTNPLGLVGMNGRLFTGNRDDQRIYNFGKNELNGLPSGSVYNLKNDPFDVSAAVEEATESPLPSKARGQALFPGRGGGWKYLYELFNVPLNDDYTEYDQSILVRLAVDKDTGALSYNDKIAVMRNAQGLGFIKDAAGVTRLVLSGIGGYQWGNGKTNGTSSYIASLPALGYPWSAENAYRIHLTGDPMGSDPNFRPLVYDIRTLDIAYRGWPGDIVVIFVGMYSNFWNNFSYAVYYTTAAKLLSLNNVTISEAAAMGAITYAFGETNAPGKDLWDICIAMGETPADDILLFRGGSEIRARLVRDLGKPGAREITYGKGLGACKIGGYRINCIDVTGETIRQSETGMPKKRALGGTPPVRNMPAGTKGK